MKHKPPATENRILFELQADLCRMLAHPVRLEIIDLLKDGELSGSQIVALLGIPKANASQHLGILKDAGLIEIRKQGVQIYAQLALEEIVEACTLVRRALAARLEADRLESQRRQSLLLASFEPRAKQAHSRSEQPKIKETQK